MHLCSTSLRQEAAQAEAQVALQHNSRIALFVCSRLGPDEANLHPIAATVGRRLSLNSTVRHMSESLALRKGTTAVKEGWDVLLQGQQTDEWEVTE